MEEKRKIHLHTIGPLEGSKATAGIPVTNNLAHLHLDPSPTLKRKTRARRLGLVPTRHPPKREITDIPRCGLGKQNIAFFNTNKRRPREERLWLAKGKDANLP